MGTPDTPNQNESPDELQALNFVQLKGHMHAVVDEKLTAEKELSALEQELNRRAVMFIRALNAKIPQNLKNLGMGINGGFDYSMSHNGPGYRYLQENKLLMWFGYTTDGEHDKEVLDDRCFKQEIVSQMQAWLNSEGLELIRIQGENTPRHFCASLDQVETMV